MTTANLNVRQILIKRGNTAAVTSYVGPIGELVLDANLKQVHVQDGVTPGGIKLVNQANIGNIASINLSGNVVQVLRGDGTWAADQTNYSNSNVASYLTSYTGNINAGNIAINGKITANNLGNVSALNLNNNANHVLHGDGSWSADLTDYSNANVKTYLSTFDGNIIPSANITYSLGNETNQWKDLWVSNNTIYLNSIPISIDASGTFLVNNSPITGTTANLVNGVSIFQLFANGQTRSPDTIFAANGVSIINANGAIQGGIYNSGDADFFNIGASTGRGIKFYVNEETDGPLFFANGSVNFPTNLYSVSGIIGDVSMYGGTISGTNPNWNNLTLVNQVEGSVFVQLPSEATANVANLRIHNDIGNVEIATGDGVSYHNWYFGNDGDLTIPRDIFGTGTNPLVIQNTSTGSAYLELPIAPGTNAVYLANQDPTGNVVIRTGDFGFENDWIFGMDDNLTIPGNIINAGTYGQLNFVANSSGDGYGLSTIQLVPYTAGYDSAYIVIDPTYPNHIHIRAGGEQDNSPAQLFLGGENSYVSVDSGLDPNVYIRSNNNDWTFGTDGRLQLPDIGESSSEIFTGSGGISIKSPSYTELRYSSTDPGNVSPTSNTEGYIWITNDGAHIQNYHGGQFNLEWLFGTDGNLIIPGNINYANGINILSGLNAETYSNSNVVSLLSSFGSNSISTSGSISGNLIAPGANTRVLFNDSGAIGSSSMFTYDKNGDTLTIGTTAGTLKVADIQTPQGGVSLRLIPASGITYSYGHLNPLFANTYDIGQTSNRWRNFYTNIANIITANISGTINGNTAILNTLSIDKGVHEKSQSKVDATGNVTHDCSLGHIFYHTSPDDNWTANFTNLNLNSGYATALTIIIAQGATAYYANAVQIEGVSQTINWQGNTAPTVTANRTDICTFSVLNNSGTYLVLGQITGF